MDDIYSRFIRPHIINEPSHLKANRNQVAGHSGICSLSNDSTVCLKPFNIRCVRGRREHLFYQLVNYVCNPENANLDLYYKHFPLLTIPSQSTQCDCKIDTSTINSLSRYVPKFYNINCLPNSASISDHLNSVYSQELRCPCYGLDANEKTLCARDYERTDFLCLEDLAAHCKSPCIMDIKIGQITYDPMAIKEKIIEQSTKYERSKIFGFRILGMKFGSIFLDKTFGKKLETNEHVLEALDSFLSPLDTAEKKLIVVDRIIDRLTGLLGWFEEKNINQLCFYSSSLLLVYDYHQLTTLADSVRVSMIDFAHVFHTHNNQTCRKDINYLYGLRRLREFFVSLVKRYRE